MNRAEMFWIRKCMPEKGVRLLTSGHFISTFSLYPDPNHNPKSSTYSDPHSAVSAGVTCLRKGSEMNCLEMYCIVSLKIQLQFRSVSFKYYHFDNPYSLTITAFSFPCKCAQCSTWFIRKLGSQFSRTRVWFCLLVKFMELRTNND